MLFFPMACEKCFKKAVINTFTSSQQRESLDFLFIYLFLYICSCICDSTWVRKCVWMNSTRLEKYMFWCPSFPTSIWELLHPSENESHNNSHCSPFLTAIIAFPFFPQTICNLLPAANGFYVWLLFSLFLPPECVWWACETLKVTVFDC